MPVNINRKLIYETPEQGRTIIGQDEVSSFSAPVVILGDPGLGKTMLCEMLGEQPGMRYVRAGTFDRALDTRASNDERTRIVVDGLDEIASAAPGGAVENVLRKLSAIGNPPFILSCREADWLGATDRNKIKDDYGVAPVRLHLQPFTRDDASTFLTHEFPGVEPESVLDHLASRGIEALHGNPLTLRMLGEVAQVHGPLPESRAQLFDRACRVMLTEINDHHRQDSHARRNDDELLLAAGAMCAAQLLCDRLGVHTGPYAETPERFLNIADVATLRFGKTANDAVKIRLFKSEGESRFTHIHRVVAEYLGAKWLVRCFEDGVSQKRIFGLFRQREGVPTSLRGLHAWIAHFSDDLATPCIGADPYAVLRYGDAETLGLDQARTLLAALLKLSEKDPYFRSEDWGRHPLSGLMRLELQEEILSILETPNRHAQLRGLLLEAMAGTALAKELSATLESIAFDRNRRVVERSDAAKALHATDVREDWEPVIDRLLETNDPDSARLAFEFLRRIGLLGVPEATSIHTLLAYFGFSPTRNPQEEQREFRYVPDSLFSDIDTDRLAAWLDTLVEAARPLMENAHFEAEWYVTSFIRRIVAQVLESNPSVQPERVWNWIGRLNEHRGHDDDVDKRLVAVFREKRALRAALLEHVLLTPCAKSTWMAGHRLFDMSLGLYPTEQDLAGMLEALRTRAGGGRVDAGTWRDLLLLGRTTGGVPAILRSAAVEVANGDSELLSMLDEISRSPRAEWEARRAERDAEDEAHRQAIYGGHRHILADRAKEVAAGNVHVLATSAAVYLGRNYLLDPELHFDSEASPEQRLREFLGDELADRVMSGFVAVLDRDDLPAASRIAKAHCENERCVAEASMICGVAEMLRQGHSLDKVDGATLAATYMAWQRGPESESAVPNPVDSALEAAIFQGDADWEAHFRRSIEPQLDSNRSHPNELCRLTRETRFSAFAGRLSVEWLRRYATLSLHTQTELLICAIENAPREEMRALLIDMRDRAHPDRATELLWLSADYVIDLEERRQSLAGAAAEHPEFIWAVRDRIATENGQRFDRLSINHLVFIVEAFGTSWPNTDTPTGGTVGDCNVWDASEFIRWTVYAIAKLPSPEATQALQRLVDRHAQSYVDTTKHALALQQRARRDHEYSSPGIEDLRAVVENELPGNIRDMRAWFEDRIETLQERIQSSDTDMWETYWNGDVPRDEDFCRNRLVEHISVAMPQSIRFGPETRMPLRTRADIALTRNAMKLPIEIKRQSHREVWSAASHQLDAKYAADWQAEGSGIYIVLWFGDVHDRQLPRHPDGLERPRSPQDLRRMLIDRLPEARRDWIDVFVVDVSRPSGAARV